MIPGLPDRRYYGNLAQLKPLQQYTLLRQLHNAKRAGLHVDFRIGSPLTGLFSWAAPKDIPTDPTQKRLFITQPLHTFAYKDFEGPITSKYGMGTVKKLLLSPIIILLNTDDKIKFTRADKRNAPVYTLIKAKSGNYIATVAGLNAPPVVSTYSKEHFKNISLDQAADLIDKGATARSKIDGSGALAYLNQHGIEVYGINKDKNGNLIRYTDHIGGLRDITVPKELVGKVLRTEVTGTQDSKPLEANVLSGLLNSNLGANIKTRKEKNIQLGLIALALAGKQDLYNNDKVQQIVKQLNTPKVRGLKTIDSKQLFLRQLQLMKQKKHPLTNLGFVVYPLSGRPLKAKLTQDADVVVKSIFPALTKEGKRAGGFSYSLPGSQLEVGRVGTGFDHATLKDMLLNPLNYIGRTAKITAQQQYPSGAYRAPRFISFRAEGD